MLFNLISDSWDSINPEVLLCGEVAPKLFGLPLAGELVSVQTQLTKTSLTGGFAFSPSFVIANSLATTGFPGVNQASFGFSTTIPDPVEGLLAGMSGKFSSPDAIMQYAAEEFSKSLERTAYTIGYEFAPLGLKMADAEARVVLPNLTNHPASPQSNWVRPEPPDYPSRRDLLAGALQHDLLANPTWKGTADDLYLTFDEDTQSQVQGLRFQNDYFPHGGLIGASHLSLPKAIVDSPPDVLQTIFDPDADILSRLGGIADYTSNYLLTTMSVHCRSISRLPNHLSLPTIRAIH